jgi:hypothetical protein
MKTSAVDAMAVPVVDVTSLLQDIHAKGKEVEANDDQSRQALLASAKALVSALESPAERIAKISWHEVSLDELDLGSETIC